MLSASSFNALLKTLEEPPPHVKFLLATTDPQKIPATILSRCLQFSLKNLSPERVVEYLKQILEKELISFDEAALWLLGRAADGSMRDALSLTDQAIAFGSGKLGEHDVRQMLGTIDHGAVYRLISALSKRDGAELLAIVAELAELGVDFAGVANELLVVLHRIAIAQTVPEGLDNSLGDKQNVTALAGELSAEEVQFYYQMALQGRRDLNLAPELRGGLEMLLLRMVAFKPEGVMAPPSQPLTASASPEGEAAPVKKPPTPSDAGSEPEAESNTAVTAAEPAPIANEAPEQHSREDEASSVAAEPSKPEQASAPIPPQEATQNSAPSTEQTADAVEHEQAEVQRPRSDEPPVATASAPEEAVAAAPSVELADLDARLWREQFDAFALPGMLGSIASHCQLAAKEGSRLQFVISQGNATLLNDRHIERLQEVLADYFGQALKVAIDIGEPAEETPAEYRARRLQERLVVARQAIESDPLVQEIIAEFSAELDLESISLPEKRRQD